MGLLATLKMRASGMFIVAAMLFAAIVAATPADQVVQEEAVSSLYDQLEELYEAMLQEGVNAKSKLYDQSEKLYEAMLQEGVNAESKAEAEDKALAEEEDKSKRVVHYQTHYQSGWDHYYDDVPQRTQVHWHYVRRWVPSKVHKVVHWKWVANPTPAPAPAPIPVTNNCFYTGKGANHWHQIFGNLKQIAVSGPMVWGVDHDDHIFYKKCLKGRWTQVGGKLKYIAADGIEVWGIGNNNVFRRGQDGADVWLPVDATNTPKNMHQMDVAGSRLYGVDDDKKVWTRSDSKSAEDWVQLPGQLDSLSASVDSAGGIQLWGLQNSDDKNGKIFRANMDANGVTMGTGGWVTVPGKLDVISAGGDQVWGLHSGTPYYLTTNNAWEKAEGRRLVDISVDADHVFAVSDTDNLFFRMGTQWKPTKGTMDSISGGNRVSSTAGGTIPN